MQQQQQMQQQVLMTTSAQIQQRIPLQSNSSLNSLNAVIHQAAPQPTKRPGWSETRLSTMNMTVAGGESPVRGGISKSTTTVRKKTQQDDDDGCGRPSLAPMLGEKLQNLCHSIDPSYALDSEVQERLVEMADAFVEKVTRDSIKLARHRGSTTMDVVDVALALKKGYNMEVPGLGPPSVANGSGSSALHGAMMGGWLFAEKVTVGQGRRSGGEGGGKSKKKRTGGGSAAAAAAAAM
jgi:transcription initiation factor TFIID subunit 12